MGLGAVICIPSFIKLDFDIQTVRRDIYTGAQAHRQQADLLSLFYLLNKRKVG
jgi:hypothetical protein